MYKDFPAGFEDWPGDPDAFTSGFDMSIRGRLIRQLQNVENPVSKDARARLSTLLAKDGHDDEKAEWIQVGIDQLRSDWARGQKFYSASSQAVKYAEQHANLAILKAETIDHSDNDIRR